MPSGAADLNNYVISESSIKEAIKTVHGIVEEEISQGIDSQRIILGGFSQGGAVAFYSALTFKQQLGGVMVLSPPLGFSNKSAIPQQLYNLFLQPLEGNLHTPILLCHGDCDEQISIELVIEAYQLFKRQFTNFELKIYKGMGHWTCDEEMQDAKSFIDKYLPPYKSNL
jgi:lysophospholipase-2